MPTKPEAECHCGDHSGLVGKTSTVCEELKMLKTQSQSLLPRSSFHWTTGTLVTIMIVVFGYIATVLNGLQVNLISIDKGLAVLSKQVDSIEKRNDLIDRSDRKSTLLRKHGIVEGDQ